MADKITRILSRWATAFVLFAFVLGILLGLGLGWHVWPVRWYNTDPSDLRVEHQMTYVVLTADSYALTADSAQAVARLETLLDEDTTWEQVANLVERVAQARESAGDPASALRVRQLARVASLPAPTEQEYEAPKKTMSPSVSLLGAVLLGVAALVVAAGLVTLVLSRRQPPVPAPEPVDAVVAELEREAEQDAAFARPVATRLTGERGPVFAMNAEAEDNPAPAEAPPTTNGPASEQETAHEDGLEPQMPPASAERTFRSPFGLGKKRATNKPAEPAPALSAASSNALGSFEAEYSLGQDDFDCSFSIESPEGDFYGECGIGIADVLSSEGAQKVDAFELWLFDKADIRTVSRMLVSEYVLQDQALSSKLSAKGELVPARAGLVVELVTMSLRVTATIKACRLADEGALPNAYFAQLAVDLVVNKIDAA
jgi:hypothetical protein